LLTNFKRVNKNNKVIPIKILPAALFVFINKITESSDYLNILKEASILNILSIGLVDTDQDPYAFHYPIPGNTKSFESICFYYRFFLSYLYLCSLKTKSVFFKNLIFSYNKIYATLK
jgi:ribosomal protein S2